VDITAALNRLDLSRHDCAIRVIVESDLGAIAMINDVPTIPRPVLTGPMFEDLGELLTSVSAGSVANDGQPGGAAVVSGDVRALQRRLGALGFYAGLADGVYGPETAEAVKAFQIKFGLVVDAAAGPQTKVCLPHAKCLCSFVCLFFSSFCVCLFVCTSQTQRTNLNFRNVQFPQLFLYNSAAC
jgi:hypothetical protein